MRQSFPLGAPNLSTTATIRGQLLTKRRDIDLSCERERANDEARLETLRSADGRGSKAPLPHFTSVK